MELTAIRCPLEGGTILLVGDVQSLVPIFPSLRARSTPVGAIRVSNDTYKSIREAQQRHTRGGGSVGGSAAPPPPPPPPAVDTGTEKNSTADESGGMLETMKRMELELLIPILERVTSLQGIVEGMAAQPPAAVDDVAAILPSLPSCEENTPPRKRKKRKKKTRVSDDSSSISSHTSLLTAT